MRGTNGEQEKGSKIQMAWMIKRKDKDASTKTCERIDIPDRKRKTKEALNDILHLHLLQDMPNDF